MYIDINNPEAYKYDLIDLTNGKRIPGVQKANDETGEFTIIMKNLDGNMIIEGDKIVEFNFKGNIKIIKKEIE